jgi:CheY-like chemotaxis protein/HPt (histidine-containing phosphotransfer) domain-containing protein
VTGGAHGPRRDGVRVLVVDDDAVSRKVARAILERAGYHVEVAADGEGAIAAAEASPPALIIMDCLLPGMDGRAATRELRRREGGARRTPVIGLSGGDAPEEPRGALEAGMDDYLRKPVEPQALLEAVAALLGSHGRPAGGDPSAGDAGIVAAPSAAASSAPGPSPLAPVAAAAALAPAGDGGVLDPAALARLRALGAGDPGFVPRLLEIFAASAPRRVSAIRAACAAGDAAGAAAAAHPLRSNLRQLGALRAAEAAARIEAAARAGALGDAAALIADLEEALARVAPALARAREGGR